MQVLKTCHLNQLGMNALIINPLFDETSHRVNGVTRELADYSHRFSSAGGEVAADNHPSLARAPSGMESLIPGGWTVSGFGELD